ncbi:MAG TPA: GTPase ObgE [Petrotogaceae bacterium]|nr:GTPase ObgE [Petrotogaceae bacterium]
MEFDFLDEAIIEITAGKGGDGAISFRREKFAPFGGPDGGNGGTGGHIIIQSVLEKNTLVDFKYKKKFLAQNGENGKTKNQYGCDGEDMVIEVPVGTVIYNYPDMDKIADLQYPNEYVIVARGGIGGRGNSKFATSTLQAPRISEKGIEGEKKVLKLELKLLADIGIVGFPNVGKSSLISKISNARPKIANYPFTTLIPNLGVVKVDEGKSFVVADIPGLIEGAHEGVGLGDKFLKHIERCFALVHMIDGSEYEGRDPINDYYSIRKELEKFNKDISSKEEVVVLNKTDTISEDKLIDMCSEIERAIGKPVIPISCYTGYNVDRLKGIMYSIIQDRREEEIRKYEKMKRSMPEKIKFDAEPVKVETVMKIKYQVVRIAEHEYEIVGDDIIQLLSKFNIFQMDSRKKILGILEKNGLEKLLRRAGVSEGDTIFCGEFAFEYVR